jgi:hypothetical protein
MLNILGSFVVDDFLFLLIFIQLFYHPLLFMVNPLLARALESTENLKHSLSSKIFYIGKMLVCLESFI